MTDQARGRAGAIIETWWRQTLRPDTGPARGLRARLRRATDAVDVLSEPQAVALYDALGRRAAVADFAALLPVLAHVETNRAERIAKRFGAGEPRPLTELRFRRLIRSDGPEELAVALRRALPLIDHGCNVAALCDDFLNWNERTRIRWCLDYYGKAPPEPLHADAQTEETA